MGMDPHQTDAREWTRIVLMTSGNRVGSASVYASAMPWTPGKATPEQLTAMAQMAVGLCKRTLPQLGATRASVEFGGALHLVAVKDANGTEVALYRVTKNGDLRQWRREWSNE